MNQQEHPPAEPWRGLDPAIAEVIEPELPAITKEIFAAIGREVPEYAQPLEGAFGRGVRLGVDEALRQFVALVRDPDAGRGQGREVYVALGRGEMRQGRSLDALLAAYRVGARVAWRRLGAAGLEAGLDPEILNLLAESIFAYIDGLSAESIEGYAEARSALEGERERRRTRLIELLVAEPPAAEEAIRAAAGDAGWRLPPSAAALACPPEDLGRLASRLGSESVATVLAGLGCAIVPDPEGPGRPAELERAARGLAVAIGPKVEPGRLGRSWSLASRLLNVIASGGLEADGLSRADEHLVDLLLAGEAELLEQIAARRLAVFDDLSPRARERMRETLLAYLRRQGNVTAIAEELHVHPQTVRYRMARLRELLGAEIDDPDARFELEAALRGGQPPAQ